MTSKLFPNMQLSARLFVFNSESELTESMSEDFSNSLAPFLAAWKAHGAALDAGFRLIANRVLFIVVDEEAQTATGCSIDSLTHFLKQSGVNWFDRTKILHAPSITSLDGPWSVSDLGEFHSALKSGEIPLDHLVLNTTVLRLEDFRKNGLQTVSESWHSRML